MTKCKRPSAGVNKEMLSDAHKNKMEAKRLLREHYWRQSRRGEYILANLSQHHPDYGDTPQENEARKFEVTEKSS